MAEGITDTMSLDARMKTITTVTTKICKRINPAKPSDESHNPYMDLGSIIGSLDMLGFMVWELAVGTTNSTGYYIENGMDKRSCEGVDVTRRHLIGCVLGAQHGCRHGVDMPICPLEMVEEVATESCLGFSGPRETREAPPQRHLPGNPTL